MVSDKCAKCLNVSFDNLFGQLVDNDVVCDASVPSEPVSKLPSCEVVPLK